MNGCQNSQKIRCTNCNQYGHHIRNCIQPISSYGIVAFRIADPLWDQCQTLTLPLEKVEFLMIERRNTYGFVEIIRGKYKLNDIGYLRSIISETTQEEQYALLHDDFETLWRNMWGVDNKNYKHDFEISKEKFQKINSGIEDAITKQKCTLSQLIIENESSWKTAEWGFPKGKPNLYESAVETAEREFCEETGLMPGQYSLFENIYPFQEIFHCTNQIQYKHIYYLAYIPYNVSVVMKNDDEVMAREIGDIKWLSYKKAMNQIRSYNSEKKELLMNIYNVLKKYNPLLIGPITYNGNYPASNMTMALENLNGSLYKQHNRELHGADESRKGQQNHVITGKTYADAASTAGANTI